MKIKKKKIKAIEIHNVRIDVFDRILKSLQHELTPAEQKKGMGGNDGGWALPLALSPIASGDDGAGYMVLFPPCIEYDKTRILIEKTFKIKLSDYNAIIVYDCR